MTLFTRRGGWVTRGAIALAACALALLLEWHRPAAVVRLDEGLRDAYLRLAASTQAEDRLVVIDIDEATLSEVGPWPWSRAQVADLVEILLGAYGARAVGLDIVFPEQGDAPGDARLAALAAHAPLALAQILDYTPRSPAIAQGVLSGGIAMQPLRGSLIAHGHIANHANNRSL